MNLYGYGGKREQQNQMKQRENIQEEGSKIMEQKIQKLKDIHQIFSDNLSKYAAQYKEQINKNPEFRNKFNDLCEDMGVNPMISRKNIFSDLGFGDFYNMLAIQILDICNKSRAQNGGIMKCQEIIEKYFKLYKEKISLGDIQKAMKTIEDLGNVQIIQKKYVCIVPIELKDDSSEIISIAEENGFISFKLMEDKKKWSQERFERNINILLQEGLVWQDKKTKTQIHYYFPSMINEFCVNLKNYIQIINQYF